MIYVSFYLSKMMVSVWECARHSLPTPPQFEFPIKGRTVQAFVVQEQSPVLPTAIDRPPPHCPILQVFPLQENTASFSALYPVMTCEALSQEVRLSGLPNETFDQLSETDMLSQKFLYFVMIACVGLVFLMKSSDHVTLSPVSVISSVVVLSVVLSCVVSKIG